METKKVIYEVNVKAKNEIADEFFNWLNGGHIENMLKIEGFISARLTTPDSPKDDEHKRFTCQYKLVSMEAMESYFKNHAAHMREEGIQKFGDKFTAERRVLTIENSFKPKK
jgi:hypothetical protein